MGSTDSEIVLYNNRRCPWAHRAHIALTELGLTFTEETVDLDTPRTPEYLAVNPRGLVPSLRYGSHTITESGVVANFLANSTSSNSLLPASGSVDGALTRARIQFFVETYFDKVQTHNNKIGGAKNDQEAEDIVRASIAGIVKEIEPLLTSAGPYFGGSDKLTLAEVLTGPFVIRLVTLTELSVWPSSFANSLAEQAPNYWKWANAVAKHSSVTAGFDKEEVVRVAKKRIAKARSLE